MELRQLAEGAIGVGTRFHRRRTWVDTSIEGTMEVVEFEPERSFGVVVHDDTPDGPLEMHSRVTVEPEGEGRTTLKAYLDTPGFALAPNVCPA